MIVNSKFQTFYLVRKVIAPILFLLLSILFLYQGLSLKEFFHFGISLFFFSLAAIVLIINLASISKLIIEESKIVTVSFLFGDRHHINFSEIEKTYLEFVRGVETEAGIINPGYYQCVLILEKNREFIISPEKFENYSEIIKAISYNRTKLIENQGFS